MKKPIQIIFFLFISAIITAQVTSVSYMIDFDYQIGDTLYYDCNLRIDSGTATTSQERFASNAFFTIVTPAETNVEVIESYMPLLDNLNYTGTEPSGWEKSNQILSPSITPESNYFSIIPNINPISFYNDLAPDNLITLFRIIIVGEDLCSYEPRIFNNDQDPTSAEFKNGSDYSNGFTVGNFEQTYSDNFYSDDYADDIEITLDNAATCVGGLATLSPNLICAPSDLSYSWNTGEITPSITVYNEGSVEYTVTITGPNSYAQLLSAEVNNVHSFLSNSNNNTLCIGQQQDLKLDNGLWTSSDPSIVFVDSDGIITGISAGTSVLTYMDDNTGCEGNATFTVMDFPIAITGNDEICIGETTTLSSGGEIGAWVSSDPNIGVITNAGLATGISSGQTTFTFTSNTTLCQSAPSEPVTVYPSDIITIDETKICPGESTFASSTNFGGTWSSSNGNIATINSFTGEITALNEGCAVFYFTPGFTGCISESDTLCVSPDIQVSIIGSDLICVGGTTQLSPSSGGLWVSADSNIATVDNSGLVIGTGLGTTVFSFQDTVNYCAEGTTGSLTVGNIQGIANLGSDEICLNTTTQLSPNAGGYWVSSNTNVAFSNSTGEVTGVGIGTALLVFTTDLENCQVVDEDINILVNELPTIELTGPSTICAYDNTTISTNGTLQFIEYGGSAYTNEGVITGIESGITYYYAINSEGCSSDTIEITVTGSADLVFTGPDELCIGETTQVLPSIGGTWTSNDNNVVSITDGGLVTAVGAGTAILDFTDNLNGCVSSNGLELTVHQVPTVSLETNIICVGSETLAYPSTGGTWASNDSDIATISNSGLVVAHGAGTVQLVFTPISNSCPSEPLHLTVKQTPTLITEQTEICLNDSLLVHLSGTTSFIITGPNGFISTHSTSNGSIKLGFPASGDYVLSPLNESAFNCQPEESTITVFNNPTIEPASNPTIYVGETLEIFSPDFIASLSSEDESIALPISSLSIIGVSEGMTQITAISEDGCTSNTTHVTVLSMNPCQGLDTTDQSYILGTAYIDNNENGIYDMGDAPLRNVIISTEPGDFSILTDDNGNYILPVANGAYTLTAKVNEGSWAQDLLSTSGVEITNPCNEGYDFGFVPIQAPEETASLSMVNTISRCDWETNFTITVENTGATSFEGVLVFTYDDQTTLFTTDLIDFQVNGNTISSEIGTLPPFTPRTYRVTVKMPSGSSNLPLLAFEAKLYSNTGAVIEEYGYTDQLRCSYDPNDKREYPDREGDDNLTLMDEDLEYTIRFQNNGNDTAFQVKIVDPLDPNIEPSTIRVVNSSHPVETCIEDTDLVFLFENILLVDSTTNYTASQGFVTFRCNTKGGIAEMTPVHNRADIIFDINAPIVTNQTINTLVSVLCTNKETLIEASICDGELYEGFTESGTYTNSFELPYGCDSIVTILLDVQGITVAESSVEICEGESIFFNGINYTIVETTEIIDSIYNQNGCISEIISLQVNVNPVISVQIDTTICQGFDYEGLTVSGTYSIDSFDLATGCQLEITINLNVLPTSDPLCTVGTDNLEEEIIKLYPNPARESVFIETKESWESIKIVDTQGKVVLTVYQASIGKLEVNISQYSSGVYMIVFQDKNSFFTKRFVVE